MHMAQVVERMSTCRVKRQRAAVSVIKASCTTFDRNQEDIQSERICNFMSRCKRCETATVPGMYPHSANCANSTPSDRLLLDKLRVMLLVCCGDAYRYVKHINCNQYFTAP